MQRLDRALQRQLLEHLRDLYPDEESRLDAHPSFASTSNLWANVTYLRGHGLVEGARRASRWEFSNLRITVRGLDFLEDDGGLSAILGVVTMKLHAGTVRDLLAKRIDAAPLPSEQKAVWLEKLKALPAQAAERLVLRLAEAGADRGWEYLRSVLEQVV